MPRYLTEEALPTIECCGVQYEYDDREEECLICGEMLDWEDAEQHWNPEDLEAYDRLKEGEDEDPEDVDKFYSRVMGLYGYKGEPVGSFRGDDGNVYYGSLFKDEPPTRWDRPPKKEESDQFLDKDLPNEVL